MDTEKHWVILDMDLNKKKNSKERNKFALNQAQEQK